MTYGQTRNVTQYIAEHKTGRLVVSRLCSLHDIHEVAQVEVAMSRILTQVGSRAVICADWRAIDVFAPTVAERVVSMLSTTNSRLLRSAILLEPHNATFNLQVERVIRDAGNPSRRSFRNREKLHEWLAEFLGPDELKSAKDFLAASA